MIGELNRRVTVKSWTTAQDSGGGLSAVQLRSYSIWAKVEARSGQPFTSEEQQVWNYDYKITFRYERSRIVGSNFTVDYDSKRLRINSISFSEEGNRKYCLCRCSTIDSSVDTSGDIVGTTDEPPTTKVKTFDYYGIGDEDFFTADGTAMTAPTVATDLRGRTVIGAFKDGIEFAVLLTGSPSPLSKEVVYNSATGRFTWSIPYEPGEHTLIQYF